MPEKFITPAQEILSRYKKIGHQEVLKEWRAIVPAEARKEWIRSFAEEKGGETLKEDSGLFRSIILKHLPDEKKDSFINLRRRLAEAKKHERYEDELIDVMENLENFVEENINEDMLNEFVKAYVSSFETDEERTREFFQTQEKITEQTRNITASFFADGKKVLELNKYLHLIIEKPDGSVLDIEDFTEYVENNLPEDFSTYVSTLVIYGSAAIGPRKQKQSHYKKKQDMDFLFIPKVGETADRRAVEYALAGIVYMNCVMGRIIDSTLPGGTGKLDKMEEVFPELIRVSKDFKKEQMLVEIHGVSFPDSVTGTVENWRRLCGPHRIVSTMREGWQEDYKYFLDAAVRNALAKRNERKISKD